MSSQIMLPFLKWAGGKRWLVSSCGDLFPKNFNNYIEPFLGSGAVYFYLRPDKALLADANSELIDLYLAIRERPDLVVRYLSRHAKLHDRDYYYKVRAADPRSLCSRAARTLYLNRTCWNALYRVNAQGVFNVPVGTKSSVLLPSDDFNLISSQLKKADIKASDFEDIVDSSKRGDFVFVDPPYTVRHNNNGFVKYNEKIFSWDDQIRLRDAVDRAVVRGVKVLVTNADHESVRDIYKDFNSRVLSRSSVIAGDSSARGRYNELAIMCW